jgi:hypothetical protein
MRCEKARKLASTVGADTPGYHRHERSVCSNRLIGYQAIGNCEASLAKEIQMIRYVCAGTVSCVKGKHLWDKSRVLINLSQI